MMHIQSESFVSLSVLAALLVSGWTSIHGQTLSKESSPGASALAEKRAQPSPLNQLSEQERLGGWKLLFDGKTTRGWRGFNQKGFPSQGWVVEEGCLRHLPKGGGGDIITVEQFSDFEFDFEWRVAPGANGGVKYFVKEERKAPIGHEYQIVDDQLHPDAKRGPKYQAAALYDLLPPEKKELRPVGDFNHSRIVSQGKHVEHWLNGKKVLAYELESGELRAAIAQSKFKNVDEFGTKFRTPILIQDHGDELWFRNLKIRELAATASVQAANSAAATPLEKGSKTATPTSTPSPSLGPSWKSMFDGRSLKGWKVTDFAGHGEVEVAQGQIVLGMGAALTGINWTNELPKINYEVTLEAKKVDGSDFFCGLTFPVGESFCSFIIGGWGGGVVGLSSIDGEDASQNETTKYLNFEKGRWYRIRLRVAPSRIEGWIDQEKVADLDTTGRKIAMRFGEIELSKPFGVATWVTTAALREIQIRELEPEPEARKPKAK